ncbi:TPA: hypothetical protein DIC39_00295, partial [Patescibacteria group bacterium]|nr:hypothetical protein [Patescibacteria group bacterium]
MKYSTATAGNTLTSANDNQNNLIILPPNCVLIWLIEKRNNFIHYSSAKPPICQARRYLRCQASELDYLYFTRDTEQQALRAGDSGSPMLNIG